MTQTSVNFPFSPSVDSHPRWIWLFVRILHAVEIWAKTLFCHSAVGNNFKSHLQLPKKIRSQFPTGCADFHRTNIELKTTPEDKASIHWSLTSLRENDNFAFSTLTLWNCTSTRGNTNCLSESCFFGDGRNYTSYTEIRTIIPDGKDILVIRSIANDYRRGQNQWTSGKLRKQTNEPIRARGKKNKKLVRKVGKIAHANTSFVFSTHAHHHKNSEDINDINKNNFKLTGRSMHMKDFGCIKKKDFSYFNFRSIFCELQFHELSHLLSIFSSY